MPKPRGYPQNPATLGDHLKKRRMERGLLQREVAERIGVNEWTIHNWENNRTAPAIWWVPRVIDFLGYAPYAPPGSFEEWFDTVRRTLGIPISRIARVMGIDPGTLSRWLRGLGCPPPDLRERVRSALSSRSE